jgi:hypothetical protein
VLLQYIENYLLQGIATDAQPILAGTLVARRGAAQMRLADEDVTAG